MEGTIVEHIEDLIAFTFIGEHKVMISWPIRNDGARGNRVDIIYENEVIYSHYEPFPLAWENIQDAVESTVYALSVVSELLEEKIEER